MRGATVGDQVRPQSELISIHTPLAGCDKEITSAGHLSARFQSTRPVWGATTLQELEFVGQVMHISIHAPLTGCDAEHIHILFGFHHISIHAPHAGRDSYSNGSLTNEQVFQSTRPVRGATHLINTTMFQVVISIHAPRAGRDR